MDKTYFKNLAIIFSVSLIVVLTANYFILAWTEPTADPPDGGPGGSTDCPSCDSRFLNTGEALDGDNITDGTVDSSEIYDGSLGVVDVDSSEIQTRVSGTCSSNRWFDGVNEDGTANCGTYSCPCGACWEVTVDGCGCSCGGQGAVVTICTPSGNRTDSHCDCTPCCSCFVAGTEIAMAGGAYKRIEDVEIGDQVLGHDGAINTVMKLERPLIDGRGTWFINNKVEVTGEHPFLTDSGWKVPDLELFYKQREAHGRYQDIEPRELEIGDVLILQNGAEAVESLAHSYDRPEDEIVYDLLVDGNHTYIADGFVVWDSN